MKEILKGKGFSDEKIEEVLAFIEDGHDERAVLAYLGLEAELDGGLENFEEAYQGEYGNDEKFVQDLLEGTGTIPELPPYVYIDWESTARDVMMDYMEQDGQYFRNL